MQRKRNMEMGVQAWWLSISILSVVNIAAWFLSVRIFLLRGPTINPNIYSSRKAMLWLSGIYTIGCAFRSFFPRIDLERICLVDSWFSTIFVGRTVATLAELSFIVLCVLLLREAGRGINSRISLTISLVIMLLIVIAEAFSWYAAITTHYLGSVIEEALWTIAGILLITSFISLKPKVTGLHRHFLNAMIIFCLGYIIFMVTVDVPMYWNRWQEDITAGTQYLSFTQGLVDTTTSCMVNFSWDIWYEEIPWMTLYFTVAVWLGIYLPHAPDFKMRSRS
ncbi:MAG: hypothetical protein PVF28_03570 [Thioalkalispiraceae bacterium]